MTHIEQQFDQQDCQLLARETRYDGFFKVDQIKLRHRLYSGEWSEVMQRELFIRANATCVLPYDPVEGTVVLLEQFRAPLIGEKQSPWLIELVAGMNETGETPLEVAHREAKEEADLALLALEPIMEYWPSPGGSTEKVFLYCAKVESKGAGGIHGLASEHEDIRVHVLSVESALQMMQTGQINNAAAIIALQWLALNRERLDEKWQIG